MINLPGSPRSIREILDYVFAAVPYCVDLIGGPYITTDPEVVDSFRPPMQDANDSSESLSFRTHMAKMKTGVGSTERENDEIREIEVKLDFTPNALSSLLYSQGNTQVLVCVTKAPSLPRWFPRDSDRGWVHAEYSLLPGSTDTRFRRERSGAKGRTMEIERLVARSLRGAVDLEQLGPVALTVDCDILNADGGTRCASITAANIALRLAVRRLISSGECLPKDRRLTRSRSGKARSRRPLVGTDGFP